MITIFGVAIFGGLGALARWFLVQGENWFFSGHLWPYSLLANGLGCFALGFVHHLWQQGQMSSAAYTLATVGFLGGLTTFSGIVGQTFLLFKNGQWWQAALLFFAQWVVGFGSLALAFYFTKTPGIQP
jgi:fluoride exporter